MLVRNQTQGRERIRQWAITEGGAWMTESLSPLPLDVEKDGASGRQNILYIPHMIPAR